MIGLKGRWRGYSLFHLMHAIVPAHARTRTTTLKRVKNSTCHFFMTLIVWDIGTKKIKEKIRTSDLIVDHFSLTFVNLLLAWMLYFHAWHQNKGKFLVWSEYYDQFGIYQPSGVSLVEPLQNNLSNPEAYSESCPASKMECSAKILNG